MPLLVGQSPADQVPLTCTNQFACRMRDTHTSAALYMRVSWLAIWMTWKRGECCFWAAGLIWGQQTSWD